VGVDTTDTALITALTTAPIDATPTTPIVTPIAAILRAARNGADLGPLRGGGTAEDRAEAVASIIRAGATPSEVGGWLGLPADDTRVVVSAWCRDGVTGAERVRDGAGDAYIAGHLHKWLVCEIKEWDGDDDESVVYRYMADVMLVRVDGSVGEDYEGAEMTVHPDAPPCCDGGNAHEWRAPYSIVGGCRENPGVWGSGHGQCMHVDACVLCGCERRTDHGATNMQDGTCMTQVSYEAGAIDQDRLVEYWRDRDEQPPAYAEELRELLAEDDES